MPPSILILAKAFQMVECERESCVVIANIREIANELLDAGLALREGGDTIGGQILDGEQQGGG
jgi:hypothetical protein